MKTYFIIKIEAINKITSNIKESTLRKIKNGKLERIILSYCTTSRNKRRDNNKGNKKKY